MEQYYKEYEPQAALLREEKDLSDTPCVLCWNEDEYQAWGDELQDFLDMVIAD